MGPGQRVRLALCGQAWEGSTAAGQGKPILGAPSPCSDPDGEVQSACGRRPRKAGEGSASPSTPTPTPSVGRLQTFEPREGAGGALPASYAPVSSLSYLFSSHRHYL